MKAPESAAARRMAGFTLVDILCVCGVSAVLAGVAAPSWLASLRQSRRIDAVAGLDSVRAAQERYRANNGLYAADLQALGVAARSPQGLYTLALQRSAPDRYRALATPSAGSAQQGDQACTPIEIDVNSGFVSNGPDARCWSR